jgi:hypothetical protein|tara:strand:+ start:845 stop:1210 length:366 start_codon:yes stop_codon:yes gene_type:complete
MSVNEEPKTPTNENTSEQMLIDMSNQMKDIVDKKDEELDYLKRKLQGHQIEILSWWGLIQAENDLLSMEHCEYPMEIQTISDILTSKVESYVKRTFCKNCKPSMTIDIPMEILNLEPLLEN